MICELDQDIVTRLHALGMPEDNAHVCALTALAWLAEAKGIYVSGSLQLSGNSWWALDKVNDIETEPYDTPTDLVRAIMEVTDAAH